MKPNAWYSFQGGKPTEEHISFYDPALFPWVSEIKKNYSQIKNEISAIVEKERASMPVYFNTSLVEKGTRWKTFSFMFWGIQFPRNMKQAAVTASVMKNIPGIVSCSISMLEAGSRIKPHRGDTNTIIRCHIPISIPGSLPKNGFRVAEDTREWKEGEVLLFNDSEEHEAWNLSEKERVILILDVLRPQFMMDRSQICSNVLSGLGLQYLTSSHASRFIYKKRWLRLSLQKALYFLVRGALPFYRILR